ncbi:M48 family metallopeptidase [Pseudoxanthomonas composti]|uniref:M48 family peptidase n=1 Tax=Pseudoxanthomonas composti TaxID=2137479 RepID=A0A4Q1JWU0_9GAMM|nr:M48 family peptidase [Pseudoxanthomonas composti]
MRQSPFGGRAMGPSQPRGRGGGLFGSVRWLVLIGFAIYAAISWFGGRQTDPYTGQDAHYGATPAEESELGVQAYQQVLGDARAQGALVPEDAPVSQQVRTIAQRLVARVPQVAADLAALHQQPVPDLSHYDWAVSVIQSDEANAFCLPGGKIAVYTGLVPVAENADAMAVVMGHEIAHALMRHGAQRMAQQKLVQLGQVAAGMSGIDQQTMAAIGAGVQYGWVLPYGRGHETQADEVGLMLAAAACYDPKAAIPLWERMSQLGGGQRPPEFASTHPDPDNRISHLQSLLPQAEQFRQKYCGSGAAAAMR